MPSTRSQDKSKAIAKTWLRARSREDLRSLVTTPRMNRNRTQHQQKKNRNQKKCSRKSLWEKFNWLHRSLAMIVWQEKFPRTKLPKNTTRKKMREWTSCKISISSWQTCIVQWTSLRRYLNQKLTEDSIATARSSQRVSGKKSLKIKEEDPEDDQDSESSSASKEETQTRRNPGDPEVPLSSEDESDDEEDKDSRHPRWNGEAKGRAGEASRAEALRRRKPFRYIDKLPKLKKRPNFVIKSKIPEEIAKAEETKLKKTSESYRFAVNSLLIQIEENGSFSLLLKKYQWWSSNTWKAHQSVSTVTKNWKLRYFWPKMDVEVAELVAQCLCARGKSRVPLKTALKFPRLPRKSVSSWDMDGIWGLPIIAHCYRWILVAQDYMIKHNLLLPITNKDALTVAALWVYEVYDKFGFPQKQ